MRRVSIELWRDADRMLRGETTPEELAAERDVGVAWTREVLQVAEKTQRRRLPDVSVRTYSELLKLHATVERANRAIQRSGPRLRDISGPMESTQAIEQQLRLRQERGTLGQLATAVAVLVGVAGQNGAPTASEGLIER